MRLPATPGVWQLLWKFKLHQLENVKIRYKDIWPLSRERSMRDYE